MRVRKFVRILLIIAIWAAVTWVFREKLLPVPKPDERPPPHFRSDPAPVAAGTTTPAPPPATTVDATDAGAPPAAADSGPSAEERPAGGDDLTEVRGIGPVYRHRLAELGITTFAGLAAADIATVAAEIDVAESQVTDWVEQAHELAR